MSKNIAVLGAMDTKGEEFRFLIAQIHQLGHQTLVINGWVMANPPFEVQISAEEIAERGGQSLSFLREKGDRGVAMSVMARGAALAVAELAEQGRIDGIIGMGGSGGTAVFAEAVRRLPVGFPKLLVTTLAAGNTRSIVGTSDLVLMPAVVDVAGLNRISRRILSNAANAICGMVESSAGQIDDSKPLIAATMLGNTTPAVDAARQLFEAAGYEVLVFHAIGVGGMTMESLIAGGWISGVYDLTTTELISALVGSPFSAGDERLTAAGKAGIPQIVSVGCLDFSIFGRMETVPEQYHGRLFYHWNPETTLMRTNLEESRQVGTQLAERLNLSQGKTQIWLPRKGLSQLDAIHQPFWLPEADAALFEAIRGTLHERIPLVEMDNHINDVDFARQSAMALLDLMNVHHQVESLPIERRS